MEGNKPGPYHQRHVTVDAFRDLQSPRFRAIIRATSGRRKRGPDVKSFSHELNSKGRQQNHFRKFHGLGATSQEIMAIMRSKFRRLKLEVDAELGAFAADLVGLLDKTSEEHPEWSRTIEDLLVVTRDCADMSADDLWVKCEGIVQNLDDRRQELPAGPLKQIHTRVLFILTRYTRLLQFQKEAPFTESGHAYGLHQLSDLGVYPLPGGLKSLGNIKNVAAVEHTDTPGSRDRISSWKKLPPGFKKIPKKTDGTSIDTASHNVMTDPAQESKSDLESADLFIDVKADLPGEAIVDDDSVMICRICDLKIPKLYVDEHSRICTIADRCDLKGLTVDERLERVAEILEKILETCSPKNSDAVRANQESVRVTTASTNEEYYDLLSHHNLQLQSFPTQVARDSLDVICSVVKKNLDAWPPVPCETHVIPPDLMVVATPLATSSPRSSFSTPRASQIDLLLMGRAAFPQLENFDQIHELLDIVHCIESTKSNEYTSLEYLHSCLIELQEVVAEKKVQALIVETFGRRIEKLLQEKFAFILRQIDDGKTDSTCAKIDEESSIEGESVHSSRTDPHCLKIKERTTIEDFEIIKPVSRGAFGRVFLAKKRVTGDLFAIKVLKKADMIRKNAVESILAERDILISVRNPFVVRFFYSFTCRDNLYLVMEYLNGGDLYSLLRNLGCLNEEMTRTYIAEVVLALEYLHSLHVIHRDLKPDNLLIAQDGHIKLTDFGLSKVGLINSTDDLSGPDISNSVLLPDHEPEESRIQREMKREQRQKQSVVGTPDYLAPEILLGTSHGPTADWWSVGIILFELLVGIPPFNAEHPQKIFDNIMNRDIPWPQIPEEMSSEAYDLIDKLLIENPVQRLGATGAQEVKSHPFFKDINWGKLAEQKAAFIPSIESDEDTSYFCCRHSWNSDTHGASNSIEVCSMSSSSSLSYDLDEEDDECGNMENFGTHNRTTNYSFSNFSFKNLSQLASINYDLVRKDSEVSSSSADTQVS